MGIYIIHFYIFFINFPKIKEDIALATLRENILGPL